MTWLEEFWNHKEKFKTSEPHFSAKYNLDKIWFYFWNFHNKWKRHFPRKNIEAVADQKGKIDSWDEILECLTYMEGLLKWSDFVLNSIPVSISWIIVLRGVFN